MVSSTSSNRNGSGKLCTLPDTLKLRRGGLVQTPRGAISLHSGEVPAEKNPWDSQVAGAGEEQVATKDSGKESVANEEVDKKAAEGGDSKPMKQVNASVD